MSKQPRRTAIEQGRVAFDALGELYRPGVRVFGTPDGLRSPVGMTVLQSWYEQQNTLFGPQKNFMVEIEFLASVGDAIARVAFRDFFSAFRSGRPVADLPYQPLSPTPAFQFLMHVYVAYRCNATNHMHL